MSLGRNHCLALAAASVEVEQVAAAPVADILAAPVAVLVALALAVADRLF